MSREGEARTDDSPLECYPAEQTCNEGLGELASLLAAGFLRLKRRTGCLPLTCEQSSDWSHAKGLTPPGPAFSGSRVKLLGPKATIRVRPAGRKAGPELSAFLLNSSKRVNRSVRFGTSSEIKPLGWATKNKAIATIDTPEVIAGYSSDWADRVSLA